MSKGLPSTSGLHGSGQFQPPVQVPLQASFPHQMGVVGPPGSHMSLNGGNIQQMDQNTGQNFENLLKSTISQVQSMAAGMSGGNSVPQSANSSSSRNVERKDSMNTGMARLSLADSQPHIPTTHRYPPITFSSDRQIGSNLTDQMGSLDPSTSNLSPFSNAVHHGSHLNPSLAPLMNEPVMGNVLSLPTETRPYRNNPNSSSPPASTSPFNLSPSFIVSQNSNFNKHDHSVHETNIDSFNECDNTIRESYNDNSLVDSRGKHSCMFYSMV